jgi:hypothetical protein
MKSAARLILLLFLATPCLCGYGQTGGDTAIDEFDFSPSPPDRAQGPLIPATAQNPSFQLRVHMLNGAAAYTGNHSYKGLGRFQLQTTNTQYDFHYNCAYSFNPSNRTYQARWVVPGKKLEILLIKPGGKSVKHCRVSTTPAPV